MIYPTHFNRPSRTDPEAANSAAAPFWRVNAVGMATPCCMPLTSHTFAVAEEHSTAQHGQLQGHMHTQGRQPHRQTAKCCRCMGKADSSTKARRKSELTWCLQVLLYGFASSFSAISSVLRLSSVGLQGQGGWAGVQEGAPRGLSLATSC